MKKLMMTLAAVASLGFVVSCSDEVLDVNLNKDSEVLDKTTIRTGKIEGTYKTVKYIVGEPNDEQPLAYNNVYKTEGKQKKVVKEEEGYKDSTYKQITKGGVAYWVREVVREVKFTADLSTVSWTETYATLANVENSTDYKDYYNETDEDTRSYTINLKNVEYDVPTLTFIGNDTKSMTKAYSEKANTFDSPNLTSSDATASVLTKDSFKLATGFDEISLTKVGDTYYAKVEKDNYKNASKVVTFEGDLEDGDFRNLVITTESKKDALNEQDKVVEPEAWTDTRTLTITSFTPYN